MANENTIKALAVLDNEGAQSLQLAASYARTLESLARRMQSVAPGRPSADRRALRSAALRLEHTAKEGLATLVSVIVQSARLEMLATIRASIEPTDIDPK